VPKDPHFKDAFRSWFEAQSEFKNLRQVASGIGIPFNTVRGYWSGKSPSGKNLALVTAATGLTLKTSDRPIKSFKHVAPRDIDSPELTYAISLLDELAVNLVKAVASIPPAQSAMKEKLPRYKRNLKVKATQVQSLLDALQRVLEPLLDDPKSLQVLRETVSGSDAGYLSGLLGALFDDRRLESWRELTTYRYGSK